MTALLIGIDVGGTFTDFVLLRDGRLEIYKQPTTPEDQSLAIVAGLTALGLLDPSGSPTEAGEIVHGTTAATNALLERGGARTALLTSAGFSDVLEIGRQNRPFLYRLHQQRPPDLVPPELRFEAAERIDVEGRVLQPLEKKELDRLVDLITSAAPESLAISFLSSYRNPEHEERAAAAIREALPHLLISSSSAILPEYREYERTATTVVNAYVRPLLARYLDRLTDRIPDLPIRIMQSNGGAIGVEQAAVEPARLVLSGPAGGVVGAFGAATLAEEGKPPSIITFDMGGTSSDVALCPGVIARTAESEVAGLPLRLPILDIHTVGAGGGSLARVDAAGGLRVGPQSAGARPGPVAYGLGGTEPTVTDANLVLGRLAPDQFLGGEGDLALDLESARGALARLGEALGGLSAQEAALGVIRVANATMERALRRVSVERGHDPRDFTLVPFGGAGPLHACDLADSLQIGRIFLPPSPGVLSALGLLMADVVHEGARAILSTLDDTLSDPGRLQSEVDSLSKQAVQVLAGEGFERPELSAGFDMRYRGQSFELNVPVDLPIDAASLTRAGEAFHRAHLQRYGYERRDESVEIVTLRIRASGSGAQPRFERSAEGSPDPASARIGERSITFGEEGPVQAAAYRRELLRPGHRFTGPAIVYQFDTTTLLSPGWHGRVDGWGNLWLARGDGAF